MLNKDSVFGLALTATRVYKKCIVEYRILPGLFVDISETGDRQVKEHTLPTTVRAPSLNKASGLAESLVDLSKPLYSILPVRAVDPSRRFPSEPTDDRVLFEI